MPQTKMQKTVKWGIRITIVLLILAGLIIGVLKIAEQSTDALKMGLQDYLTNASGHPAEITILEKATLFPDISFSMKGILVRDKENKSRVLVSADKAHVSVGFWKSFFGIRNYKAIQIDNMQFATGYLLPQKLNLSFAGISDPLTNLSPPYFLMEGLYNKRSLLITARMERHGEKEFTYDFENEFPVTFKLGNTEANAIFKRGLTAVDVAHITIVNQKQEALLSAGDISFDPLNIPLTGKIAGVPVKGNLVKSGEIYKLTFQYEQSDEVSLSSMDAFLANIRKDLGLNEKNVGIVIEAIPAQTELNDVNQDKEKSNK